MSIVLRILDANANRTREALRVMEEAARFILDDTELVTAIKQMRHDLAHAISQCKACDPMAAWRDTPGDVGTAITTQAEQTRTNPAAVVIAAGKRLSESLRAMEEYAKTLAVSFDPKDSTPSTPSTQPTFASQLEALRYRGYKLEQQLNTAMAGCRTHEQGQDSRAPQWRLCVLISESLCPDNNWLNVAKAALKGGVDCLQLREKDIEAGELLTRALTLVQLAKPSGASIIINDRPDVAMLAGAHGVHLGQGDLPCTQVRKLVGPQMLIGVSTSSLDQAKTALRDGADYCGVGPMFPTTTKHKDVIVGETYLREFLAWNRCPHLAIGGINQSNLRTLVNAGVQGIAVSSAVCSASDPALASEALLKQLQPPASH